MKFLTIALICLMTVPSLANRNAREGGRNEGVREGKASPISGKLAEFATFSNSVFGRNFDFGELSRAPEKARGRRKRPD